MARTKQAASKPARKPARKEAAAGSAIDKKAKKKASPGGGRKKPAAAESGEQKEKKPRRYHAGTVVRRDILKQQKSVEGIFQKGPFKKLLDGTVYELNREAPLLFDDQKLLKGESWRVSKGATRAVQALVESDMNGLLRKANFLAHYAHRTTVNDEDLAWAQVMRGADTETRSRVEEILEVPGPYVAR